VAICIYVGFRNTYFRRQNNVKKSSFSQLLGGFQGDQIEQFLILAIYVIKISEVLGYFLHSKSYAFISAKKSVGQHFG
jgi:hypothetical protein